MRTAIDLEGDFDSWLSTEQAQQEVHRKLATAQKTGSITIETYESDELLLFVVNGQVKAVLDRMPDLDGVFGTLKAEVWEDMPD